MIHPLINPNQCNKHCLLDNPWLLAQMNPWILPLFSRGIEPRFQDGFLGVFFGGTMKLWRDRLRWNHDAKNTYVPLLHPSINVNHFFEKSCLFSISHFDLPLLLLVFSFDPRHNMSRMGTESLLKKNPAASVESKVLDPHQFTPSLVFEIKESRDVLKAIRFEMLRTKALQGHIYPCSHVHGRILPFHDYLSLT